MKSEQYVVVIGAANIDIGGSPFKKLIYKDSNPGDIVISYGGVGRNISHNLTKLGVNVKLAAAMGGDVLGDDLIRYCENVGINTDLILTVPDEVSSMYMYINDESRDMQLAVSHVEIVKKITPSYIDSISDVINGASIVVADCNLSHETLMHIKDICKVPLCIDPVSQSHALKIKDHLDGITIIKPNKLEAELLTGISINSDDDYRAAASSLLDQGVEKVFITMGERGILVADSSEMNIIEAYDADDVMSTTGAGDSATAAIVWTYLNYYKNLNSDNHSQKDLFNKENIMVTAGRAANAAALITIQSDKTISPDLTEDAVLNMLVNNNSYLSLFKDDN